MHKVDVLLTTYNSETRISKTLDSLVRMNSAQKILPTEWRLTVVNNNSTDNTVQVIESYRDKLPLQIFNATRQGKSAAMNDALSIVTAPLIAFTDDDVDIDTHWLDEILSAAENHPDYDMFSGKIVGVWEKTLSPDLKKWIPVGSTYALHEDTMETGECDPGILWGRNMAIRKSIFDKGHRFNEEIGPTPNAFYAMGEDTELCKRLAKKGYKSFFISTALVKHTIKKETANEDWIIRRAERLGYGIFAVDSANYHRRLPDFIPIPLELIIMRVLTTLLYPITLILVPSRRQFWMKWLYYFHRGLIKGYLRYHDNDNKAEQNA